MADSTGSNEGDEEGKVRPRSENYGVVKRKMVRQPNRRQHEKDVQALTEQISSKEAELKSLGRPSLEKSPAENEERESLQKELKRLREQKEATILKRKEYHDNIHKLSDAISKKSDAQSKLKANLPHKTCEAVDEAIHKLEYQLQTQHFKLRDEKRIINEITNLKRSKKQVTEYLAKRAEIDLDIKKKEEMKIQRTIYFKKVSELKSQEDEVRQKIQRNKSKADEAWTRYREAGPQRDRLKKEIDDLFDMRRQLNADFQASMKEFRESVELQKIENERKKEDEKKEKEARHRREWFEYESTREPFEAERAQIEGLMAYLQKLLPKGEGTGLSRGNSPLSGLSPSTSISSASSVSRSSSFRDEEGTFTVLRKKTDEDDDVFLQAAVSKKKKNKRKSAMHKPLRHSREMFNQFAAMDVSTPSTAMEIPELMDRLHSKLQYYEDAAASVKMAHSAIPQDLSASSSFSSSFSSGIVMAMDGEDGFDTPDELQPNIQTDTLVNIEGARAESEAGLGRGNDDVDRSDSPLIGACGGEEVDTEELNVGGDVDTREDETWREESIRGVSGGCNDPSIDDASSDSHEGRGSHVTCEKTQAGVKAKGSSADLHGDMHGHSHGHVTSERVQMLRRDSAADESGSSGGSSDDGKEAGNVTDDSESTVVAHDGESGQSSPSDGSASVRDTRSLEGHPDIDGPTFPEAQTSHTQVVGSSVYDEGCDSLLGMMGEVELKDEGNHDDDDDEEEEDEVDKDREDSGAADVQEGDSRKGSLVERRNESLRLIMSRRSEKELEPQKSDLLASSSQTEYSSDYASNSTGSSVSTPTDLLPLAKQPLLMDDPSTLQTRVTVEPRLTDDSEALVLTSQHALQLSYDALHASSQDNAWEQTGVYQSDEIPLPKTQL